MRKKLYELLNENGYKAYAQGQLKAPVDYPYVVVLMGDDSVAGNSAGSLLKIELLCYVPDTSIFQLDPMIQDIKGILIENNLADEFEGIGRDYHDTTLEAFMRNLKFRIPCSTV